MIGCGIVHRQTVTAGKMAWLDVKDRGTFLTRCKTHARIRPAFGVFNKYDPLMQELDVTAMHLKVSAFGKIDRALTECFFYRINYLHLRFCLQIGVYRQADDLRCQHVGYLHHLISTQIISTQGSFESWLAV